MCTEESCGSLKTQEGPAQTGSSISMRIIFIRHGEPDYANDCLTATGRKQAEALSRRLVRENITELYSSPLGRAAETAAFTAKLLGLTVRTLDFMQEISWGGEGIPVDGHPWTLAERMIDDEHFDFYGADWRSHPYFAKNSVLGHYTDIAARFDELMEPHGYRHEANRFFCTETQERTIAVFSHGGSGACALSHLLSLPLPYVLTVFPYDYTSVIILNFPVKNGSFVHPRVELFNDAAHISGLSAGIQFQQAPD